MLSQIDQTSARLRLTRKNIPTALEHYNAALNIHKKNNLTDEVHSVNRNIAVLLTQQGKYEQAIEILNKAYDYFNKNDKYKKIQDKYKNTWSLYLRKNVSLLQCISHSRLVDFEKKVGVLIDLEAV